MRPDLSEFRLVAQELIDGPHFNCSEVFELKSYAVDVFPSDDANDAGFVFDTRKLDADRQFGVQTESGICGDKKTALTDINGRSRVSAVRCVQFDRCLKGVS